MMHTTHQDAAASAAADAVFKSDFHSIWGHL